MKILFLFMTQSEAGAPGYLSRLGEDASSNLAESLSQFVQTLGLDLESDFERRVLLLEGASEESQMQQSIADYEKRAQAVLLAQRIYGDVLLLSGSSVRSKKTISAVAEYLALPVVEDPGLDRFDPESSFDFLGQALQDLLTKYLNQGHPSRPRLVVVQSSLQAFRLWLSSVLDSELSTAIAEAAFAASESDRVPALVAAGYQGPWPGQWLFETH